MNRLKRKLGKNGGFTIVEMLIVVAIIAILIAISIPMFSAALERTRHAVDDANYRDAISLANIEYLTRQSDPAFLAELKDDDSTIWYGYVVDEPAASGSPAASGGGDYQGHLVPAEGAEGVESKCTGSGTNDCTTRASSGKHLQVSIDGNGNVTAQFK